VQIKDKVNRYFILVFETFVDDCGFDDVVAKDQKEVGQKYEEC